MPAASTVPSDSLPTSPSHAVATPAPGYAPATSKGSSTAPPSVFSTYGKPDGSGRTPGSTPPYTRRDFDRALPGPPPQPSSSDGGLPPFPPAARKPEQSGHRLGMGPMAGAKTYNTAQRAQHHISASAPVAAPTHPGDRDRKRGSSGIRGSSTGSQQPPLSSPTPGDPRPTYVTPSPRTASQPYVPFNLPPPQSFSTTHAASSTENQQPPPPPFVVGRAHYSSARAGLPAAALSRDPV